MSRMSGIFAGNGNPAAAPGRVMVALAAVDTTVIRGILSIGASRDNEDGEKNTGHVCAGVNAASAASMAACNVVPVAHVSVRGWVWADAALPVCIRVLSGKTVTGGLDLRGSRGYYKAVLALYTKVQQ